MQATYFESIFPNENRWSYKYFSKSAYSDQIDLYWVTACEEIGHENQFLYLWNQWLVINRMLKIQYIVDLENFRRTFLNIFDLNADISKTSLIEQYSLPIGYVEMVKQIEDENDPRNQHLHWVVHTDTEILETIVEKSEVLHDFKYFCGSDK